MQNEEVRKYMELGDQSSRLELPAYECQPLSVREERAGPGPQLQLVDVAIVPGSPTFAKGKALLRPLSDMYAGYLSISLVCSEEAIHKGNFGVGDVLKTRDFTCSRTIMSICQNLKKGFVYEYEFSFQCFSDEKPECSKCQTKYCDSHTATPPSVGSESPVSESFYDVAIRYFLQARIDTCKLVASKFVYHMPVVSSFDLNLFRDASGPLNRLYEVGTTLKSGFLKKDYNGTLALQMHPVYHYNDVESPKAVAQGKMDFKVLYYPSDDLRAPPKLSASYVIRRVIIAAPGGMKFTLDHERYNTKRIPIGSGKIDLKEAKWEENTLSVSAKYEIQSILAKALTYASCYSYCGYELTLTIKHPGGEMSLTVPLVILATSPPSYS